mmetsp:Transcript_1793/g.4014  ORF Transcript_1793/g.4014 Transcript_1793/m.4014 type:complete len:246 (+) Transcript_1793:2157-2894(+)
MFHCSAAHPVKRRPTLTSAYPLPPSWPRVVRLPSSHTGGCRVSIFPESTSAWSSAWNVPAFSSRNLAMGTASTLNRLVSKEGSMSTGPIVAPGKTKSLWLKSWEETQGSPEKPGVRMAALNWVSAAARSLAASGIWYCWAASRPAKRAVSRRRVYRSSHPRFLKVSASVAAGHCAASSASVYNCTAWSIRLLSTLLPVSPNQKYWYRQSAVPHAAALLVSAAWTRASSWACSAGHCWCRCGEEFT